jgi:hypothetical protein
MTRALLCLALVAQPIGAQPAIASTPTVEVVGYTDTGEYVRLRGVMLGASYSGCAAGPCLDVVADQIVLAFDGIFSDGFDDVSSERDGCRW